MKDELGGQVMKKFFELRARTYSYLKDNNDEDKKAKCSKKFVIKKPLNYKNRLEVAQIENKINHKEKHNIDVDVIKEYQKNYKKQTNIKNTTKI